MKISIIDDGVGAFATLNKLKRSICADYYVQILEKSFPLGNLNRTQLQQIAVEALSRAENDYGCDAVVFSSIALSMAAVKTLTPQPQTALFGCEAPILHASTYTASQVLLVGDVFVARLAKRFPNVIPLALPKLVYFAEEGADDRTVVAYISENAEQYYGSFDCIALGLSCGNLYRHCFSRVFPNAQIFDSLEGVARKLRKKFKKNSLDDSTVRIFGQDGADLTEKYNFFVEEL